MILIVLKKRWIHYISSFQFVFFDCNPTDVSSLPVDSSLTRCDLLVLLKIHLCLPLTPQPVLWNGQTVKKTAMTRFVSRFITITLPCIASATHHDNVNCIAGCIVKRAIQVSVPITSCTIMERTATNKIYPIGNDHLFRTNDNNSLSLAETTPDTIHWLFVRTT